MATVTRDSKGVRIWFKDGAGKRKSIRLGDAHDDYATRFALNLEDLNSAVKYNATIRPEIGSVKTCRTVWPRWG
jgi:hypothetical protein